ncbi:MAG TPA: endonuclease/exonuclease/phosphatase family protein [Pirellulaceae bacterium]|nr:endonuclease/exonuclease/phosphatase family protein [Pirellulaceae bacterium]
MALYKGKLFKRRSAPQLIVGFASSGMPWLIRWILGTRLVSKLIFLLVPILITIGVLTLDWSNGWPTLSLNRARVTEVGEAAKGLAKEVQSRIPEGVTEKIRERIPEDLALDRWSSAFAPSRPSSTDSPSPTGTVAAAPGHREAASTIRIASFNIQVFGTSKASKPHVMHILANVVRQFDIVAIQELRTTDESVMEGFLALINAQGGGGYRYIVGQRLGRTSSKEQYVFVYDATRVDVDPQSVITVADPQDYLHREPTIARFQVRSTSMQPGFSFILANIHTDPDETDTELDALADVFVSLQQNSWGEDDVILLGDLNVSYQKLGRLGRLPNIAYTVHGEPTNTRGTQSYDNIVFDRLATREFTGTAGILNLQEAFGLSLEQAIEVSDHWPIWAEFDVHEHGTQVPLASQPGEISTGRGQARVVENPLLRLRGSQR